MERKNSLLLWRARDVMVFILSVVGLALLLVYGSRAISAANDRRYVEGLQKRPLVENNDTMAAPSYPSILAHIIPMEEAGTEVLSADSSASAPSNKTVLPATDSPGQKNGLLKNELPDLNRRLPR